jgi:enoyl-CoA hydratase/carnithine racemase
MLRVIRNPYRFRKVYELPLGEGLDYESRIFYTLFSTEDQKEGMETFLAKRKAEWKGK